jgi:hypothetical protein
VWPDVSRRLQQALRARGLDQATVDDVIQETAARALARGVQFADADELFGWALVVARNYATDLQRRSRFIADHEVPDRASPLDLETLVEHRSRVRALRTAFSALRPGEQQALQTPIAASNREAVRRHRARTHLRAILETLVAWLAWVLGRRPRTRATAAAAVAAPAVALIVAVTLQHHATSGVPPAMSAPTSTAGFADASVSVPAPAPVASGAQQGAATGSGTPAPARPPYLRVAVPGPDHRPVGGELRPKQPGDHDSCLDTVVAGYQCLDLPGLSLDQTLP